MQAPPEFYCLKHEEVIIENFNMKIWHYLICQNNESPSIIWIFDKITMTVLANQNQISGPLIRFTSSAVRTTSIRIFHNTPHLLIVPDLASGKAYHTNLHGNVYAGSNTFGEGHLCLGDSFAPYDFSAVHLLCNYNANSDLPWVGNGIEIETPINNAQRMVKIWPIISQQKTIPKQITEFFNHS